MYIVYYSVYCDYFCCVSELHIYVPSVMYGLRLFIVVLQELYCLLQCLS